MTIPGMELPFDGFAYTRVYRAAPARPDRAGAPAPCPRSGRLPRAAARLPRAAARRSRPAGLALTAELVAQGVLELAVAEAVPERRELRGHHALVGERELLHALVPEQHARPERRRR